MSSRPVRHGLVAALGIAGFVPPITLPAQVLDVRPVAPPATAPSLGALQNAQQNFEFYRRQHLPSWQSWRSPQNTCDVRIGRFCYWYDETEPPPPPEPRTISDARTRLILRLDSAGRAFPNDRWISGQLVRYLTESGRFDDAVAAARACTLREWWCTALQGFALHVAGRYAAADSAFTVALALMGPRESCDFRDMKLLLDDAMLRQYGDSSCTSRLALERRLWWLARPMLSSPGNDARTEYYAREMMAVFVADAPSTYQSDYADDEREMLLRYGWPTAWSRRGESGGAWGPMQVSVVGHEPMPAHPYIPAERVLDNPAASDSEEWRSKGIPPVPARYAPAYAKRLLPLAHQEALFRRGDSALVVVAWSVAADSALSVAARPPGQLSAALVLTKGDPADATIVHAEHPADRGVLTATAAWGSMLMSTEVAAPAGKTLARARYGVRGSDQPNSRVQISDLLLFDPYDGMPNRLEDALPHMLASRRIPRGGRVGVYWEAYNTSPAGEPIAVSITVAPQDASGGWLRRGLIALRLVREAKPVTVGIQDVSARGTSLSPRSVVVDLSTLGPGVYLMELELDAGGGNVVRAEKVVTVDG
jgi:hypothetical protein